MKRIWRSRRRLSVGWWLPAAVALLIPFMVAVDGHRDNRPAVTMAPAQAWLGTTGSRALALVDGPSASLVKVVPVGQDPSVVQAGSNAYAITGGGRALHVSGVTYEAASFAVPTTGTTRALASGGDIYLYPVDGRVRRMTTSQPVTLRPGPALPDRFALAATQHDPAVVDLDAGRVTWYDGGRPGGSADVGSAIAPGVLVAGDEAAGDVYLVDPAGGAVTVCRAAGTKCGQIDGAPAGRFEQPVVAAGRLLLPEPGLSRVWAISAHGARPLDVATGGADFQLVGTQGYAFANPPGSDTATVIGPDDRVRRVPKVEVATPETPTPTKPPPTTPRPPRTTTTPPTTTSHPVRTTTPRPHTTSHPPKGQTTSRTTRPHTSTTTTTKKPPTTSKHVPGVGDVRVSVSSHRSVIANVNIHVAADDDHVYFLLVQTSDGYYARWKPGTGTGNRTHCLRFDYGSVDPAGTRHAMVVSATGGQIASLEANLALSDGERAPMGDMNGTLVSNRWPFVLPDEQPSCRA